MTSNIMRKQFIVDNLQYKMLLIIVIYILLGVLLAGLIMFFPSILALSAEGKEQYAAAKEILALHKRFWPAVFIVTVIIGGHSIFLFHRIFGPLYRFKKTMEDITRGDISYNIKLRKNDFLKDEEVVMNGMITSLRNSLESLKEDNRLLEQSIAELDTVVEAPDTSLETVRDKVNEIQQKRKKIKQGLEFFKTVKE